MTTTTMVLDRLMPLEIDAGMQAALATQLANIGLGAIGSRGKTLVIRVQNHDALPTSSFRRALRAALDAVPGFWDTFDNASFN